MSWEDMMRRILPPIDGASPHVTSRYGERFNRPIGSSNPHGGIDFNYEVGGQRGINLKHPDLRSPVDGVVENAGRAQAGGSPSGIGVETFMRYCIPTVNMYVSANRWPRASESARWEMSAW